MKGFLLTALLAFSFDPQIVGGGIISIVGGGIISIAHTLVHVLAVGGGIISH